MANERALAIARELEQDFGTSVRSVVQIGRAHVSQSRAASTSRG